MEFKDVYRRFNMDYKLRILNNLRLMSKLWINCLKWGFNSVYELLIFKFVRVGLINNYYRKEINFLK